MQNWWDADFIWNKPGGVKYVNFLINLISFLIYENEIQVVKFNEEH